MNGRDVKMNFKELFATRHFKCTRDVTGIWLPGITRRPEWNNFVHIEKLLAANIFNAATRMRAAMANHPDAEVKAAWEHFGVQYQPDACKTPNLGWVAPSIVQIQDLVSQQAVQHDAYLTHPLCTFG